VLCGGKKINSETDVSKLKSSSPLLVLGGVLRKPPPSKEEGARASPTPSLANFNDAATNQRNAQDRALELEHRKLEEAKEAALNFAERSDGFFCEIQDQNGKVLQLPESDRKNLVAAQMLAEQGKKLVAAGKYEESLKLLHEAESLFNLVSPALLKITDNFGLLCLDIAWVYMKLQKVEHLQNAREKLLTAKLALELAHGKNLERLEKLKGAVNTPEKTLYVRLALLQGVVAWHRGEKVSARSYLAYAEDLMSQLRIEDKEMVNLIAMGFDAAEVRRALRIAHKDEEQAVVVIMARREELKEQKRMRRRQRKQEKLGKTASGDYVDLDTWKSLKEMGFDERMAARALQQSNNDLARSIDLLSNSPELLRSEKDNAIAALVAMGFPPDQAEDALTSCGGNVEEAMNLILTAPLPMDIANQPEEEFEFEQEEEEENQVQHDAGLVAEETIEQKAKREKLEIRDLAEDDLVSAIDRPYHYDADEEFDLNLDEEFALIQEYKTHMSV
jgi:Holliday junction resolvasome RuvABC DNA-binding subunit